MSETEEKILVEFSCDLDYGSLDGLFVTTQASLDKVIGREACFGEVLGKHSEVDIDLKPSHFTVVSRDQVLIKSLQGAFGRWTSLVGYNPVALLGC